VLKEQGTRTDGAAGTLLLTQAAGTYRNMLTVFTKEAHPQEWAETQNILGNVLGDQGTHTGGEKGKRLLQQAIEAYQSALQIRTKDALPVQWEQTMNNLKIAKKALEEMN